MWALAASYDEPERAEKARELASAAAVDATALGAAGGLALAEVAAPVRSTAVDLMRAAELVAGEPEELATEEAAADAGSGRGDPLGAHVQRTGGAPPVVS